MAPTPSQLFAGQPGTNVAERFEEYKAELSKSLGRADEGRDVFIRGTGLVKNARPPQGEREAHQRRMDTVERLSKSLPADQLAGIQAELDDLRGTLAKDWESGFPESGSFPSYTPGPQLAPIDLEAPAKLLVPRQTPLVNSMPRNNTGKGSAVQFRRITGWTNSGVGGVPDILPFMSSEFPYAQSSSNLPQFGGYSDHPTAGTDASGLGLRRGQKITYAADSQVRNYVEMGLSDSVSWKAEYIGQGFQDIRQLSATALLWAHKMGEERALLYGRGPTANGYTGALTAPTFTATPTTLTATAPVTAPAGTIPAASYFLVLTAIGGGGEGPSTAQVASGSVTLGQAIVVTVTAPVTGALGYNVYAFNTTGGPYIYQGTFSGTQFTMTAYATSGTSLAASAGDSSANPNAYDGLLTILTNGAKSGYVANYGGAATGSVGGNTFYSNSAAWTKGTAVGDTPWQLAFQALYGAATEPGNYGMQSGAPSWPWITGTAYGQKLLSDPDVVYVDGSIRKAMGDFVRLSAGGASAYRIYMQPSEATGGLEVGGVVNGLANQVTGKMVDFDVHPYMPYGCSLIWSKSLPVPDSEIANTFEVRNVQDYIMYPWPIIQYTYDASTYQLGTLVDYAPAWSGAITGLVA